MRDLTTIQRSAAGQFRVPISGVRTAPLALLDHDELVTSLALARQAADRARQLVDLLETVAVLLRERQTRGVWQLPEEDWRLLNGLLSGLVRHEA